MKKGCLLLWFIPFILLFSLFGGIGGSTVNYVNSVKGVKQVSDKVKSYQPLIEQYAKKYDMLDYVPYLMAIMQVESKGEGGDPMQSSESKGLPPNTITNVEESIEQGVIHFKNVVTKTKQLDTDVWSAVQAYNYGGGFIDYVKGEKWSFEKAEQFSKEKAKQFSKEKANGDRVMYVNDISTSKGYNYRYNYGNMFYVFLVQQYLVTGQNIDFNGEFLMPIDEPATITSYFGVNRHLILQDGRPYSNVHTGVDFVNGNNQAPIKASANGTVVFAGLSRSDGALAVIIQHTDNLYSYYWHLSKVLVDKGQSISTGDVLGIIGTTGRSTGIHLHFGISTSYLSDYVNPLDYLKR